ncbi:protein MICRORCHIDIA 6 isoform X2 [Cryptomeria japonica]|uniref:protein MICRORCHIDIA 6 isoform X2 n=1 Tax=Cryptomeria japonica TaxID=3369 RepID=UPI0025ACDB5C|nr:protein MICRORCHIDIA 6 isoform X2 [Cryptomeria japonica]
MADERFMCFELTMASLEVIDLSSDEEDCMIATSSDAEVAEATFTGSDKDSRKSYCIPETPKLEAIEQPINEADSARINPLIVNPIKQVHNLSAQAYNSGTQFDHRGLVQTPHRDAHRSSSGWQQHSAETGLCREFWKAGDYDVRSTGKTTLQNGMDHVRVHPKFLHSNATSHKWALGAIAELLDNSVDEINNGATFVNVDKIACPRDNSAALLVQDDGGGMDPDCIRQCMSLGYSRKNTNTTIGQYGNGFKTSTMRLGADVIVFSTCNHNSIMTQSIGLLSYTFLRETGHEDIVVPMVDYETPLGGQRKGLIRSTPEDWSHNLSTLLQWSPYTLESDLLKQFDDIGPHGTKVIVYNLWLNDDAQMELDFESDKEDIQLRGEPTDKQLSQRHIANRLRYSLRVYSSILYLQIPDNFRIILRGRVVEHHKIANDLKFPEYILYKPQVGNNKEVSVITTIGFTKEAPLVNVHGFNVYHKNRLIMPFWKVFHENSSRGRGVVGVLEANFIEPAHDKQDFERTAVLLRLETRLKLMTIEYWNLHCALIGYQPSSAKPKSRNAPSSTSGPTASQPAAASTHNHSVGPYEAVRQTIASSSGFPGIGSAGIGSTPLSQMASASSNFVPYATGVHMEQRNAENFETKPTILRPGVVDLSPFSSISPNSTDDVKPSITRIPPVSGMSPNTSMPEETPSVQLNPSINIAVGRTANAPASPPPTPPQQSSDIEMKDQGRNEDSGSSLKRKQPSNGSLSALANGCPSTLPKTKRKISEVTSSDELEVSKRQASGTRNILDNHDYSNIQTLDDMEAGSIPMTEQQATSEDESVNCRELEVLLEENKKLHAQCHEYEANEKELQERVRDLENELQEVQREYAKLLIESQSLSIVKEET